MQSRAVRIFAAAAAVVTLSLTAVAPASAAPAPAAVVEGSPDRSRELTEFQGALFFTGQSGSDSVLYRFDGAAFSAVPGSPTQVRDLFVLGDALFFTGAEAFQTRLYRFDGTTVTPVVDSFQSFLGVVDGTAYFEGFVFVFPNVFSVLFEFDGTTMSQVPNSPAGVNGVTAYDGDLIVSANNAGVGTLYVYDGSTFTPIFTDLVEAVYAFNGLVYFCGWNGAGWSLFTYDGVSAPVELVALPGLVRTMVGYQGSLYLSAEDAGTQTLARLDGAALTTIGEGTPEVTPLTVVGDRLYFSAFASDYSTSSAYVFDGTTLEPFLAPSFNARGFVAFEGAVYFTSSQSVDMGPSYVYRIGAAPAALAATGSDLSLPLAASALLLVIGAAIIAGRSRVVTSGRAPR